MKNVFNNWLEKAPAFCSSVVSTAGSVRNAALPGFEIFSFSRIVRSRFYVLNCQMDF